MIESNIRRIGLGLAAVVLAGLGGCATSMEDVVKVDPSQLPPAPQKQAQGTQVAMLSPEQATAASVATQTAAGQSGSVQPGEVTALSVDMPVGEPAPGIPTPVAKPGGPTIENAFTANLSGPTVENAIVVTSLTPRTVTAPAPAVAGKQGRTIQQAATPTSKNDNVELAYASPPRAAVMSFAMIDRQFDTSAPVAVPQDSPDRKTVSTSPLLKRATADFDSLISKYAALYKVPEALVHRVVHRESRYDPEAYSKGNYGLMQIRYNTAKSMGFDGPAKGLFDAESNLKYAIKYLRGAFIVADGDHDQAVRLYARGYYYDAKRKGRLDVFQ